MRVIGGEFRSRKLQSMPGTDVRPTPDKVRQALFNIIAPAIQDAVFVDAYAGTGAVGIEALSRGARHVVFIDNDRAAAELIRHNLASLRVEAKARVIRGAAALYLGSLDADVVFIDPPYPKEREYLAALEALESKPPRLAIAQHAARFELKDQYGPLHKTRVATYGDNALSFFRVTPGPALDHNLIERGDLTVAEADIEL